MPDLTHEDIKKILKIIDDMGDRDVRIEVGDLKIHVTRAGADPMVSAMPATAPAATRAAPTAAKAAHAAVFDAPPGRMAILVENEAPVEQNQILMLIEPE